MNLSVPNSIRSIFYLYIFYPLLVKDMFFFLILVFWLLSLHLAVFLLPIFLLSDCFDTTLQLNINTLIALTFILKGKKLRTNIIRFDPDTFSSVGPEFGFHYGRIRNSKHVYQEDLATATKLMLMMNTPL